MVQLQLTANKLWYLKTWSILNRTSDLGLHVPYSFYLVTEQTIFLLKASDPVSKLTGIFQLQEQVSKYVTSEQFHF